MNQSLQNILNLVEQSETLSAEQKKAIIDSIKETDKAITITEFKLDRTEKVKRTTAILLEETIAELELKRKAVEEQNHELEIESALERVRSVAMGMKKPEDMLDVCKTIAQQLVLLKVNEIRNVQTAIFYDEKGVYTNYEYYAKHDKLIITDTEFRNHPVAEKFANQMMKGPNEVFIHGFTGKEVKDWLDYQKGTNVFIDSYLETASSLTYYWYSLGPVALGMSTYVPLKDEEIELFKRFRNVFELAYRRYLDIEQAEAQAREAQIELGLERVRARAMAMQNSDELKELIGTVFIELTKLDLALTRCLIMIYDPKTNASTWWMANSEAPNDPIGLYVKYHEHPAYLNYLKAWREKKIKWQYILEGASKKEWDDFLFVETELSQLPDFVIEGMKAPDRVILTFSFNNFGCLSVASLEPLSDEHSDILLRFAKVFDLTYTRFNDLKQAEAQARESQIQLALERVRARTMAMQHSSELADAASLLFQQVKELGIDMWTSGYNIWDKNKKATNSWLSRGTMMPGFKIPHTENPTLYHIYEAAERGESLFVEEVGGETLSELYRYLGNIIIAEGKSEIVRPQGYSSPTFQVNHAAYFSYGYLLFVTYKPSPEAHDIFKRFASVFEQTYTRFLDLEKAEAQARESQIQLALERVRARTMAMQKSDELSETVYILFQQFRELGENPDQATIGVINEEEHVIEYWVTMYGNQMNRVFKFSIDEPHVTNKIYNAWKEGKKSVVIDLSGKDLSEFMAYRAGKGGAAVNPDEKRRIINVAFFSRGLLNVQSNEERSEESIKLLERFAAVFEQTYTRFLDLQKAEAQAKEAQIEAALERVRSRTMAMHKSSELLETAELLFDQLKQLGAELQGVAFAICDKDSVMVQKWTSIGVFSHPYTFEPGEERMYEAWKNQSGMYEEVYEGERQKKYYETFMQIPEFRQGLQKFIDSGYPIPTWQKNHAVTFKYGYLLFITLKPFNETNIFIRFGKVFEQTYTRFLDLQKAEAQARESQIQLALERVRARTMAMQKSDELQDVVHTLLERLKDLNVEFYTSIIILFAGDSKDIVWWLENKEKQQYSRILVPYTDIAYLRDLFDARENGSNHFSKTYSFEEKNELFHHLFSATDFQHVPEKQRKFLLESKAATMSVAMAKNTGIHLTRYTDKAFSEEDNAILKRFVNVFEQTYTRFLDLQKAEAQAREAQIEAALEKVRSRSMGMQKSEELKEVIQLVYEQFIHLNIYIEHTGFLIDYKTRDDMHLWIADQHLVPSEVIIPWFDSIPNNSIKEAIEKGQDFFKYHLDFEEKNKFYRELFTFIPGVPEETLDYYLNCPGLAGSGVLLENIGLYIENFSGTPYTEEENAVLMRFGKVFQQTYTRFLDLQKAEAQAREAKIEAALEKVRSRTLAMQKSDELAETAAVLFKQLILLGIEPNRLYISIIQNDAGDSEFWITDEDGSKVSFAYTANLKDNYSFQKMLDGWKEQKKSLIIDMHGKELEDYFHHLNSLNVPFKGGLSQKRRVQYIAYFSKGFIGMASPDEQPEETMQLLERFAAVFNLTFARFNDLKIAEAHALQAEQDLIEIKAARKKAEDALTELQATQKQLIQSEKMASLGELTAGIAHEIQNPLNFVNNFSDVSNELLEEMKTELEKGNTEEAKAIADDVKQNLEKILHHGKRADGIVKGMLQHSRSSSGVKEPTDINALADEYLRLAYHGLRAKDKSFNAAMKTNYDETVEKVNVIPQDMGRVILNLITNAFYAVTEKKKLNIEGYEPTVTVSTKKMDDKVFIFVKDNGNGIPQKVLDKIFQPFFTTKPTGQGTGLGLSLSYDIVKAHGGEIKVNTKENEGTEFIIHIPIA
jgi:signal transduction histidine kinase